MIRYHAAWIVPVSAPPVRDGWVLVDGGRVVARGRGAGPAGEAREVDLGEVAILPGLVNAHTHLELSYLRDAVPPAESFTTWIRGVMAARKERPDPVSDEILGGVDVAIAEAVASGTAIVGDISNTLVSFDPLSRSALAAVVFYELIRFNAPEPASFVARARDAIAALPPGDRVRTSLAAHAPYSVAPLVFRAIRDAVDDDQRAPCSVHLSESADEVEFIRTGGGAWRALLEELGVWDPSWVAPGVSPVQFLDESGFLDSRVLAVHGVQMTPADLARLKARGTTLVTCPRSNEWTGAGVPPVRAFYESGVRVAVGTDSLASAPDLNLFAEVQRLRAIAPEVPASALVASATIEGARALGFADDFGTIDAGKLARMIAVSVPPGLADVEEYLVSGVEPEQVSWLDE